MYAFYRRMTTECINIHKGIQTVTAHLYVDRVDIQNMCGMCVNHRTYLKLEIKERKKTYFMNKNQTRQL